MTGHNAGGRWLRAWLPTETSVEPRLGWFAREGRPTWLTCECSLMNLWKRHTGRQLNAEELPQALALVSKLVAKSCGMELDVASALVSRADFCVDLRAGEAVPDYIRAVAESSPARLKLLRFSSESVYFRSPAGGHQLVIYDKFAEVLHRQRKGMAGAVEVKEARGLIRVENRLNTSHVCGYQARRLGLQSRRAEHLLTASTANHFIGEAITALGLDAPIKATGDDLSEALFRRFGTQALAYLGFLEVRRTRGEAYLRRVLSPASFARRKRGLVLAGLWQSTPSPRELPPLRLVSHNSAKAA